MQMNESPGTTKFSPIDGRLFFAIAIYPFLLIWQGGDLTDTGFHATYSQNFFSDLNEGKVKSLIILTYFIGNLWMQSFPELGVWGFRLLSAFFFTGSVFLAFLTLKELRPRRVVLAGLLCAQVFALRFTAMAFDYDSVSLFFLMLTACCLWHGIRNASYKWLFAAGLASGLTSLARLPDILILGLVPVVFLYAQWACQEKLFVKEIVWKSLKQYAIFLLGFAALACFFGLLLRSAGAWEVYFQNLVAVNDTLSGKDSGTSYSFLGLIKGYLKDIIYFSLYLFGVCSAAIAFSTILQATKKKTVLHLLTILCVGVAFITFYGNFSYGNTFKYFVPALCVLPSIIAFVPHESDTKQYGGLILIAWMVSLVAVAGTATGLFLKLAYGMLLLVPLLGVLMWNRNAENIWNLHIAWRPLLVTSAVIIILIGGMLRFGWIYHVDSGLMSRLRAVYPIEHSLMRNIYTTAWNAKHIEEVTRAVQRHIRPDNSLFIYGHEPLFYYLSQQKPTLFNFWMGRQVFTTENLFRQLEKSISQTSIYPMMVVTDKDRLGEEGSDLLDRFLQKYHYRCVEDSESFQIWNTEAVSVSSEKLDTP
jgi:hypothetical protein